ncbi:unnamed protein product [Dovyalis caffra]|uniref:F-box domain-containing protein n=1 Tax=Dovyalis caffra TaxID=77055 RepID=A0AAV1RKC3_9ROSI|nr:unnamed protein product [Dovyalis caffra]
MGKEHKQQLTSRQQNTLIPDDVIEDILLNLPVKSLLRFKSVCKSWCSLFSKPGFARANFNKRRCNNHDSPILRHCYTQPEVAETIDLDHKAEPKKLDWPFRLSEFAFSYRFYSCTDGIFSMCWFDGNTISMFLWNPRINKYKTLPTPENFEKQVEYIGFGYDSSIDDYKVVRVAWPNPISPAPEFRMQVLNVKSNVWRTVHRGAPYAVDIITIDSFSLDFAPIKLVHVDGALYFVAKKTTTDSTQISVILRFDLAEESLREVSMPPSVTGDVCDLPLFLEVLGGSLHLCAGMNLWVMKEESCWVKVLEFNGIVEKLRRPLCLMRPLCFTEAGALILLDFITRDFHVYDTHHNTVRKLEVGGDKSFDEVILYSDTLISPSDDH